MKLIYIFLIIHTCFFYKALGNPLDSLSNGDSIFVNIGFANYPSISHECLIVYKEGNKYKATYISMSVDHNFLDYEPEIDPMVKHYKNLHKRSNDSILIVTVLDSMQYTYIGKMIHDFRVYKPNPNIISTAGDAYVIYGNNIENIVVIDPSGYWDKYIEIKKVFGIYEEKEKVKWYKRIFK